MLHATDVLLWVVDLMDFEGTAHPSLVGRWARYLRESAGPKLWVAANKVDLLPRQVPYAEAVRWVRAQWPRAGGEPEGVTLVSGLSGHGVRELWRDIGRRARSSRGRGGRIGVMGATNTGKSRLLARLLSIAGNGEDRLERRRDGMRDGWSSRLADPARPTVSAFPGTTADIIRLTLPGGVEVWDTPGLDTAGGRLSDLMCPACAARLVPSKTLKSTLFELKAGQALHWSGLAGFEVLETPSDQGGVFVAYASELAAAKRTKGEALADRLGRASLCGACLQRLNDGDWDSVELTVPAGHDVALAGLGWVSLRRNGAKLRLHLPRGVWYRVRPNLIGPKPRLRRI